MYSSYLASKLAGSRLIAMGCTASRESDVSTGLQTEGSGTDSKMSARNDILHISEDKAALSKDIAEFVASAAKEAIEVCNFYAFGCLLDAALHPLPCARHAAALWWVLAGEALRRFSALLSANLP